MNQNTLRSIAESLIARKQMLAVAESCTGGWLAKACTDLPGSSAWFERGIISYSNAAKIELLNVPATTIDQFGAVSEQTVMAMVTGLIENSPAQVAVATSGVAGPSGGSEVNPVGSVWFAWLIKGQTVSTSKNIFVGDRESIRRQSVEFALQNLDKLLK